MIFGSACLILTVSVPFGRYTDKAFKAMTERVDVGKAALESNVSNCFLRVQEQNFSFIYAELP